MADTESVGLLQWDVAEDALRVRVTADGSLIPVDAWAVHEINNDSGRHCRVAPILRLVEDGTVSASEAGVVRLPHSVIASLNDSEAAALGLPTTGDFVLEISSTDIITTPECRLNVRLWNAGGTPIPTFTRTGSILRIGDTRFRCSLKQLQLFDAIDDFNATTAGTAEKMRSWGRVGAHLPEEVRIDDYLASTRVIYATSFSIEPFLGANSEPDFRVIPGRTESFPSQDGLSESRSFNPGLPEARQEEFDRRFEQFPNVRARYPAGGNWYVVLEEDVERVLKVARKVKSGGTEQRRSFIQNPHAFLREALETSEEGEGASDVEDRLTTLFWDAGYSERVAGIGLWQPKVLPWLKTSGEKWLPGEELGIRIGDKYVAIEPAQLEDLRVRVETAIAAGTPSVKHEGEDLPASEATLDALSQLVGLTSPEPKPKEPGKSYQSERVVLLVKENFEAVDYQRRSRPARAAATSLPNTLSTPLPHQRSAIAWLQEHWTSGSPGALLADDMGLGKTFVALAFMVWTRQLTKEGVIPKRPMLTVGPTALLDNWVAEAEKHLGPGALGEVLIARGKQLREYKTSPAGDSGVPNLNIREIRRFDWVLTTYETWRDYQHSFGRIDWGMAVFDEVQKVKNPSAAVTDAAKAAKAEFGLALTGTPVENRLADLWCIVDLVQPGRLGSLKSFSEKYEQPVTDRDDALETIQSLRATLSEPPEIMKRRLKANHLEGLPERKDEFRHCPMPKIQAEAYSAQVQKGRLGSGKGHMLATLGALRSISLHPGRALDQSDEDFIEASARLKRTFDILDAVSSTREKALIFIESREMQGELCTILQRRYELPGPPLIINGSVAGAKRQGRVEDFQARSGFDVMLLSPKAGGVGLTLTAANHVIHLSRWWNPAVEDQCTDRIYRIGQNRRIFVYHPLAVHPDYGEASFDLRLSELLKRKRKLSQAVLAPSAPTTEDLQSLFDDSVTRASDSPGQADELESIDLMEPTAFEQWVMARLVDLGYAVSTTPTTHDGGADVIARSRLGSHRPNLIIQCKHTQRDVPLGPAAVDEVVRAAARYSLEKPLLLAVVSNVTTYSHSAVQRAEQSDVRLVSRNGLGSLGTFLR